MKIVGIIIGVAIYLVAYYKFKLEGNDVKLTKVGLWNAHKHLQKTGVILTYVAYLIILLSVIFMPY